MIDTTITILQFGNAGEKTGWTYLPIPWELAEKMNPGTRKSYRVKGRLDQFVISGVAMLPMGDGSFIIPFNEAMRKGTAKKKGAMIRVRLELDKKGYQLNKEFLACLDDEPEAAAFFKTLPLGHQNYFSQWIDAAKGVDTRARRIAMAVEGLRRKLGYGEMIRFNKKKD